MADPAAEPNSAGSTLPDDPRERADLLAKKKAELDEIASRRETLLSAERERGKKRQEEERERGVREKAAFAGEAKEAAERAEQREDWRQEQHEKRREEEKAKWKADEQAKLEEEKRKKAAAEKAKQQEYLDELHTRAYQKKVQTKRENARKQEENETRDAERRHDRDISLLEMSAKSAKTSRDADRKRQIRAATADADRRRAIVEENLKRERTRPGVNPAEIVARGKRELMAIDEHLSSKLREIDLTFERLALETERRASLKRQALDSALAKRKAESAERRRRTEEWIEKGGAGHD